MLNVILHKLFVVLTAILALNLLACSASQAASPDPGSAQPTAAHPGSDQPANPAMASWQTVDGHYISFKLPSTWQPTTLKPAPGSMLEAWMLGIPGVTGDQELSFFAIPFESLQPPDLVSEYPFTIGEKTGVKWVRVGEGYISYDYYTTGILDAGSFGLHVTVPAESPELEAELDMVASTIIFKQ